MNHCEKPKSCDLCIKNLNPCEICDERRNEINTALLNLENTVESKFDSLIAELRNFLLEHRKNNYVQPPQEQHFSRSQNFI